MEVPVPWVLVPHNERNDRKQKGQAAAMQVRGGPSLRRQAQAVARWGGGWQRALLIRTRGGLGLVTA